MKLNPLTAVSPIDGRYYQKTKFMQDYFSEYALFKYRLIVELKYLQFLSTKRIIRKFTKQEKLILAKLVKNFSPKEAVLVKKIEKKTNHDVKAVEYYIKKKLAKSSLRDVLEFVHFCLTSNDVNNTAYALMVRDYIKLFNVVNLKKLLTKLEQLANKYASLPMLARTHGQPASSTTLGKEFNVFASRLRQQFQQLQEFNIKAKLSGATGTYASFKSVIHDLDPIKFSRDFIMALGLEPNLITTQIEPHDNLAELFHLMIRINNILLDLTKDMWIYIMQDYFKLKVIKGEVGSSTMPQKVNPIDFENAEGNLGMGNSFFSHMSLKLPVSRLQRDLSDSTVMRNVGVGFAYNEIAYSSLLKGLNKIEVNHEKIKSELKDRWGLLAEPYQQVFRKYSVKNAYEILKNLSRGKNITRDDLHKLLDKINIPEHEKVKLRELTPETYIGVAEKLAKLK